MFIVGERYKCEKSKIFTYVYHITVFSENGDHYNKFHHFSHKDFFNTFYSESEIRKIKLNKLNGITTL
jgi:hypothetical protein